MKAITTLLMILGPIYRASDANIWLTGTVNGSSWGNVSIIVPWVMILTIVALISARKINIQEFGDELATGVGSHVQRQRFFFFPFTFKYRFSRCSRCIWWRYWFCRVNGASYGEKTCGVIIWRVIAGFSFSWWHPSNGGGLNWTDCFFTPLEVPAGVFTLPQLEHLILSIYYLERSLLKRSGHDA